MKKDERQKMIDGFKRFKEHYFDHKNPLYSKLSSGQTPKTLVIGCSDSRVDPAIIYSAEPGELFTIRNVANLVPAYESGGGYHGVSAAIEFAVVNLKVENIVVLGHRQCGGIRALIQGQEHKENGFVHSWMKIAQDARDKVLREFKNASLDEQCRQGEMESIVVSLRNLKTFPFIQDRLALGDLELIGTYFDLESGELFDYDHDLQAFVSLAL